MPFPNEHSARLVDPAKFEKFRRVNDELGAGIDVIFGIREDGKSEIQAIRFDKDKFTPEEARAWLKDHDDFKPILFEEAENKRLDEAKHLDDEDKKKKRSGHKDEGKQSGHTDGSGNHTHPHANGAGRHDSEGMPSSTGGHSHSDDLSTTDGAHRHRPDDPLEGAHSHKNGDDGEHRHPKAVTRKAESVQWVPDFEGTAPDYVISGEGARGLFSKIFRIKESVSADDGVPYFIDDFAVRWVPEGQIDPVTNEENAGVSCWRGGL